MRRMASAAAAKKCPRPPAEGGRESANSDKDLVNWLAAVGDRYRTARALVDRCLRVDAKALIDRRADVGRTYRTVLDVSRVAVARSAHGASLDARPRQHHG